MNLLETPMNIRHLMRENGKYCNIMYNAGLITIIRIWYHFVCKLHMSL